MLRESAARITGIAALGALGIAVWFSIVLARADSFFRAATPETVQRAVEIAPWNTEYLALRALQFDYEGADSTAVTEKIARLNPYSSAPRIRLGLAREVSGDFANAERWLLDAASVDHQFEPRWTLANFYFRAAKREQFWAWMRSALEVSYGDRTPAFDLCWRVSADASEILNRAIPDRHEVTGAYLVYLIQKKRLEAILPIARRLAAYRDASDLPLLYGACDQLIEARDPAAIEIWRLAGQATPSGIFNGDFAAAPLNHGFDWRVHETTGVTHVGHRVAFNGQQPESCSLLEQKLFLVNGRRYRFHWEARTTGIKSPSGLEWRIGDQRAALAPSDDWTPGEMLLTARGAFEVLELDYGRPMGESRTEGNVELRRLRLLEVAP
jgi:tetratricopeptide (TPR) repeat protein